LVLIQVTLPSRTEVKGHKKVEREINELVGATNARFSSLDYTPVLYIHHHIDLLELV
jgi:trehalose-6-phosphate synthase